MNYSHKSHRHCYDQFSPSCGLKSHHCCLCDIVTSGEAPKEETCPTCHDIGEITKISGSTPESYDAENISCPDCSSPTWEEKEREAVRNKFGIHGWVLPHNTVEAIADFSISRIKAIREEVLDEVSHKYWKSTWKKSRSQALEEVREAITYKLEKCTGATQYHKGWKDGLQAGIGFVDHLKAKE